nr:J domain-containing protein [Ardenticatenales bacterium]
EAYEVLSDPEKRKKYDTLGADWKRYQQGGSGMGGFDWGGYAGAGRQQPGAGGAGTGGFGGGGDFSDFFESIFGGLGGANAGQQSRRQYTTGRPGKDITSPVDVTLREAFTGSKRIVTVEGERLEVNLPGGVRTGSKIRMSGKGGRGVGTGQRGDLFLEVNVLDDPVFRREGDDLMVHVPVDLYTAVLGGEMEVPTVEGKKLILTLPPGTSGGKKIRLRGKGMPRLKGGGAGDLLVEIDIHVPDKLSDEQRELFQRLRALG